MKSCKICTNEDCTWSGHTDHISVGCLGFEPQANADRIRSMSDEELADYLRYYSDSYARYDMDWLDWLKQEVAR